MKFKDIPANGYFYMKYNYPYINAKTPPRKNISMADRFLDNLSDTADRTVLMKKYQKANDDTYYVKMRYGYRRTRKTIRPIDPETDVLPATRSGYSFLSKSDLDRMGIEIPDWLKDN